MSAAVTLVAQRRHLATPAMAIGGTLLAATLGWAFALQPVILLAPVLGLGLVLLLVSAPARAAFIVFGGLAVLQISDDLTPIKIGYMVGAGVAIVAALVHLRGQTDAPPFRSLQAVVAFATLLGAVVVVSAAVSATNGTPATDWLRDAAPYLLFATTPIFALDLESSTPRKLIVAMLVAAGLLAMLSFTVEWFDRRDLATLPLDRIALPSPFLRSALYLFALSSAVLGVRRHAAWILTAAFLLSLTWLSGGRAESVLLLIVMPLFVVFAVRRGGGIILPAGRAALVIGAAAILSVLLVLGLSRVSDFDTDRLTGRLGTISSGSVNPGTDQSFQERAEETRLAWRAFRSEPLLGTGPGHVYEWTTATGRPKASFNIDTGLAFPAKFGIVGVVALAALTAAFASLLRRGGRAGGISVPQAALLGLGALTVLNLPLGMPLEDKGFSFGLILLLALSLPKESAQP